MQLTAYALKHMMPGMLQLLVTDEFADWFSALPDAAAEDVATALELIGELGPERAPPESSESLLWYEHPRFSRLPQPFSLELHAWGSFREYVGKVLKELESPRFVARLSRIGPDAAAAVLTSVARIRAAADRRHTWATAANADAFRPRDPFAQVRKLYFETLEAAGLALVDVPAHSLSLREFARRLPAPAFRILYGVNAEQGQALCALGEWLDRSAYGGAVQRAERAWTRFLAGELRAAEAAQVGL